MYFDLPSLLFPLQMVFEANSCTHVKPSSDGTVAEVNTRLLGGGGGARGSMPYVFVRENAIKYWCTVQGGSEGEEEDPKEQTFWARGLHYLRQSKPSRQQFRSAREHWQSGRRII